MMQKRWMKQLICILSIVSLLCITIHVYVSPTLFSSRAEQITPSIQIINVQSYPKVGGTWTVSFQVEGTADLKITAAEGTRWSNDSLNEYDLCFKEIRNSTETFEIIWQDETVVIRNFSSSTMVQEISEVNTLGKHVLQFTFGNDTVYAYNDANNWWDNNWGYRKKITINHSQVEETLTNFPILINISDNDLNQKAETDGSDIAFVSYDDNTSQYAHEIEHYSNGDLTAWIKIPRITSTANTSFWMYYNNSEGSNQQNPRDVWDSNYQLIHHLNETDIDDGINDIKDSTVNSNDGTTANMDADDQIPGKINGSFDFDGENDFVNISNSSSLNMEYGITVSAWIKSDSWALTSWGSTIVGKDDWHDGESHGYVLRTGDNGNLSFTIGKNNSVQWEEVLTNSEMTTGKWYYVVGTFNGSALKAYINGSEKASTTLSNTIIETSTYPLNFGRSPYDTSRLFDGAIDEIRISNVARNDSWIQTSYNTVQNQSIFIQVGNEESAAPELSNPYPLDENENVASNPLYFEITIIDPNPELLNITWRTNQSGTWETFNETNEVSDGSYQVTNTSWVNTFDQPYWWSVNVTDGAHWTNETYTFTMHQFTPIVNSFDLRNNSGSKLNNQTGNLDVNKEYIFTINITDRNGWEDIDYINLTCWYDWGDETSTYNETSGGNFNMFLKYENMSGIASFEMLWPDDESSLYSLNCTEKIINETTRLINFSFIPGNQTRYSTSNETWNDTMNTFNDAYSWNLNCTIEDSFKNLGYSIEEYGINWYSSINAPSQVEITGAPGTIALAEDFFPITFTCNSNYKLVVYLETNLTQIGGSDIIEIKDNLRLLADADEVDDIMTDTNFTGSGENHSITLFNTTSPVNDNAQTVNLQFELSIPFGTWGTYSSRIVKRIYRR